MPASSDAPTLPAGALPAAFAQRPCEPAAGWRRLAHHLGWRERGAVQATLGAARQACIDCLADVGNFDVRVLHEQLAHAGSLAELWHLRPALYRVLALQHSQAQAERRLAALEPLWGGPS
jgi:hypothetical protein